MKDNDFLSQENKYLHQALKKYKEENTLLKIQIELMRTQLLRFSQLPIGLPRLGKTNI